MCLNNKKGYSRGAKIDSLLDSKTISLWRDGYTDQIKLFYSNIVNNTIRNNNAFKDRFGWMLNYY